MARQYTVRGEDDKGQEVLVTMALTRDRMIAIRRSQAGTVLFTPRAVSRVIDHLRELQAESLQGETWRID